MRMERRRQPAAFEELRMVRGVCEGRSQVAAALSIARAQDFFPTRPFRSFSSRLNRTIISNSLLLPSRDAKSPRPHRPFSWRAASSSNQRAHFSSTFLPKVGKNLGESLGRVSPSGNSKHLIAFFDETHSSIVGGAHLSRVKRMRKMKRRKTEGETKEEEKEKKNAA